MYNGKKILELLAERNLKQKDLLEALQTRENGSVSRFVKGDIKASRLEEIADFFSVSIDTFFVREGLAGGLPAQSQAVSGPCSGKMDMHRNKEKMRTMEMQLKSLQNEKNMLEERLKDKDFTIVQMQSRIEMLEEMRAYHRMQSSQATRTNFGQVSEKSVQDNIENQ